MNDEEFHALLTEYGNACFACGAQPVGSGEYDNLASAAEEAKRAVIEFVNRLASSAARDTSNGSIHPAVQQIIDAGPWGDGNIAVAADTFRRWATRIASWSFQLGQKQGDQLATSATNASEGDIYEMEEAFAALTISLDYVPAGSLTRDFIETRRERLHRLITRLRAGKTGTAKP